MPEAPIPHPGRLRLIAEGMLALAVVAWTLLHSRSLLDLSVLGWDAWPAIAGSARGDLLSSTFMDGLHPKAAFYRPLTAASLMLDHALYGTQAVGYQVTALILHVTTSVAVYAAARRVWGGAAAGLVAAGIYMAHPLHWEVLPYPARRGEVLALLFGMGAIAWGWRRRADAWLGLALVAAIAAKETGLVFTVALAPHFLIDADRRKRFLTHALVPVAAFLALRWLSLLGAGGYEGVAPRHAPRGEFASEFVEFLLLGGREGVWYAGFACALTVTIWFWAGLISPAGPQSRPDHAVMYGTRSATAAWAAWTVLLVGLAATLAVHLLLAPVMSSWYPLHAIAFLACSAGAVARPRRKLTGKAKAEPSEASAAEPAVPGTISPPTRPGAPVDRSPGARERRVTRWAVGVLTLALLAAWGGRDDETGMRTLRRASAWNDSYLAAAEEALRDAPPGAVLDIRPSACIYDPGAEQPGRVTASSQRRVVMLFAPYSLEAWALVALPDVPVHVRHPNEARPRDLDPATRTLLFRQPWEDAPPTFDADGGVPTVTERVR